MNHTTKLLSSISTFYNQRKDELTAQGKEWHKLIEETVKKLHQELDDVQKKHEAVLQKQKYKEGIGKVNELIEKAIKLQKSKNVKKIQKYLQMIQKQKNFSEVSLFFSKII